MGHVAVLLLSDGNADVSLQLAGVSLISGGVLELGRIANGDKKKTRVENYRDILLAGEFSTFASSRLSEGGYCHSSEIVAAFRRYYAKYRDSESIDYPLLDLEIVALAKEWSRRKVGLGISKAGYFSGISINKKADMFIER